MAQMFSKKHYEAVADTIRPLFSRLGRSTEAGAGVHEVVIELAGMFEVDSALFNRERFLAACEVEER